MFFGLPAHPLLVHLVVVLLPLALIAQIAIMAVPRWRFFAPIVGALAAVTAAAAFFTAEAGDYLKDLMPDAMISRHENYGEMTVIGAAAFAGAVILWILLEQPWKKRAHSTTLATAIGWIAVLIGVAAVVASILAGHSGASAAWGDVITTK